jgi:hypothetical protein
MIKLFKPAPPLPRSIILSNPPAFVVNRTTATTVRPPFVAILKVRGPASRYCDLVLSKLRWPLPFGPPRALYVGTFPIAALVRVDIDANEGLGVSVMNLTHAVFEYDTTTFSLCPLYDVHFVTFCGLLLSAQQSVEFTVPASDLYPAGHCVQNASPLAFANVSGAQDEHDVVASAS